MLPLAIYMLKVILISGILFGYYALALRNERFHEWNRYYLIMSVVISLVLPFVRWSALFSGDTEPVYVHRIKTFTLSAHEAVKAGATDGNGWMWWSAVIYGLIALILAMGLIAGVRRVRRRIREGEKERYPLFTLIRNRLNESPFSFFRFIFWNDQIALSSEEGGHILRHELVHVQQKHSVDKLFMESILAIFWINPFFYLIRKELHIIHEFIADRSSCQGQHTGNQTSELASPQQYATLLVKQALRTNNIGFANHFFQKQLTRRVHMLIRENKARFTWLKRVMAIPLALVVMSFFLFLQSEARDSNI
ncbi:MAG TPA: M56 family metallopeptidase, partial [Chitinophagaceae bacterium]|nr:M56 family metallopeptidase [Chitinophagaceae bacterium]